MNNLSSKIGGILLIAVGVGYLGDQLDIWNFSLFFRGWWALLIVIWGVFQMVANRPNTFNIIIIIFGAYWFLSANHLLYFAITYKVVIAVLLIYIGCRIIFSNFFISSTSKSNNRSFSEKTDQSNENHIVIKSSFSTRRYVNDSKIYSCRLENTFGSLFVDLRNADLSEVYEIYVESTFGSLELILPENVKIIAKEDNVFASSYVDQSDGEKEVYIKENCVFGSLKILKAKRNK